MPEEPRTPDVELLWGERIETSTVAASTNGLIERMTSYADIDEAHAAGERLAKEQA